MAADWAVLFQAARIPAVCVASWRASVDDYFVPAALHDLFALGGRSGAAGRLTLRVPIHHKRLRAG